MDGTKLADARLATVDLVRGRPGRDGRLVPGQRGVVARGPVGRLGRLVRAPVRPAARDRPGRRAECRRRRRGARRATDAGRRHRCGRAPRERLVAALADAPFTGPAGPIAWTRDGVRPRRTRGRRRRGSTATGRRSSSMPRPGPTWTAAPSTRTSRCGATPIATGVLAEACAARGIDLLIVSTNEVFDGTRTDGRPLRADRSALAGQPVRRVQGRGRTAGRRGLRGRSGAGLGHRPDGLAVRGARAATSRAGSSTPPSARGSPANRSARSATSGGPRPTPPTSPRPSSSSWRPTR